MDLVNVQIEDLILTVDKETATQLECDNSFRHKYMQAVREQLNKQSLSTSTTSSTQSLDVSHPYVSATSNSIIWTSSKNQSSHDHRATQFFLHLRKKYSAEFDDKKTNKNSIWSKISFEMNKNEYFVGEGVEGREKCRQKFANLQSSYIRYIDKKRQTGEGKIPKPTFFDDLQEIFGDKHKTDPVMLIDSMKSTNKLEQEDNGLDINLQASTSGIKKDEEFKSKEKTSGQNRFSEVKASVRPDKNKLLEKFVQVAEQNHEANKNNFSDMLNYLREDSERRHQQVMSIIEALGRTSEGSKKRKRNQSDSE